MFKIILIFFHIQSIKMYELYIINYFNFLQFLCQTFIHHFLINHIYLIFNFL